MDWDSWYSRNGVSGEPGRRDPTPGGHSGRVLERGGRPQSWTGMQCPTSPGALLEKLSSFGRNRTERSRPSLTMRRPTSTRSMARASRVRGGSPASSNPTHSGSPGTARTRSPKCCSSSPTPGHPRGVSAEAIAQGASTRRVPVREPVLRRSAVPKRPIWYSRHGHSHPKPPNDSPNRLEIHSTGGAADTESQDHWISHPAVHRDSGTGASRRCGRARRVQLSGG